MLDVSRSPGANRWTPRAPGIQLRADRRRPAAGPLGPATTRADAPLAREFSARTRDHKGRQWELRLLPQPLYRYESTDAEVPDGAVFAFVTSAGTDPEVFLVLEARKPAGGGEPAWQYAAARFTDLDLWVSHKEKVIFTATGSPAGDRPGRPVPLPRVQGPGHPGDGEAALRAERDPTDPVQSRSHDGMIGMSDTPEDLR